MVDAFWTIVVFAFVAGVGALIGFVFYYWFIIIPKRVLAER